VIYFSSINQEFNSPIDVLVNVKSIIELLSLEFGLVITPDSLLRIRSNLSIIASNELASFRRSVRGFQ
jgi:hypothetical protein